MISFSFSTEAEGQNASVDGQQRSDLMKRQISTTGAKPSTIAEEAVDQLQENEKLVAGNEKTMFIMFKIYNYMVQRFPKIILVFISFSRVE